MPSEGRRVADAKCKANANPKSLKTDGHVGVEVADFREFARTREQAGKADGGADQIKRRLSILSARVFDSSVEVKCRISLPRLILAFNRKPG